jgi:hypothetical protein
MSPKLREGCSSAQRKRPFSGSEKSPFQLKKRFLSSLEKSLLQVAKTLEIASGLFWLPIKASPFRFKKSSFQLKKLFLSGSEKLLFQVPKTLEIASGLF